MRQTRARQKRVTVMHLLARAWQGIVRSSPADIIGGTRTHAIMHGVAVSARLLDGRSLARRMRTALRDDVAAYTEKHGAPPCMVAIGSAADPAAETYFTLKLDAARNVGIRFEPMLLPADADTADAASVVRSAADDVGVHGIFVQYPLPRIDARACNAEIPVAKDIDGANPESLARLRAGEDVFPAASAVAIMALLEEGGVNMIERRAFVGTGAPAIAEPLVVLLERAGAHVARASASAGADALRDGLAAADVVIFPAGVPHTLEAEWLPDGAVVVDGGYFGRRRADDVLRAAAPRLSAWVPARGGVGPVTVDVLLRHTFVAASATH